MAKIIISKFVKLIIFSCFILLGIFIFYKNFNIVPKRDCVKIAIKTDNYPFSFENDKNEPSGFEVEIIKQIFDNLKIKYEFKMLNEDEVAPSIKLGLYDVGIGQLVCKEKKWKKTIFCSSPYITSQNIVYKKKDEKLSFKKIAKEENANFSLKKLRRKYPLSYILEYKNLKELFLNYDENKVSAIVLDDLVLKNSIKQNRIQSGIIEKLECKNNKKICKKKDYVLIFSKDFSQKERIEKELEKFLKSSKFSEIYNKWF